MNSTRQRQTQKIWFREARHMEEIAACREEIENKDEWRKIRERMKTVSIAAVLCLNVGVDPPDVKRPNSSAKKQAWVDPSAMPSNSQKIAQKVATNLQTSYLKVQPKARFKAACDPTVECVRKLCTSMRKSTKEDRLLFHFNGHGVPKPTEAGEIWVFNKNITQYIPLSLYDLQSWMGVPSVYVWDCSSAGTIVNMFCHFAKDHHAKGWWVGSEYQSGYRVPASIPEEGEPWAGRSDPTAVQPLASSVTLASTTRAKLSYKESIQLGACSAGEDLPIGNPDLPADLFTSCLTTPIHTSLLVHMLKMGMKGKLPPNITEPDGLPGVPTDRRTLLGELTWIFTAITDTIAWSSFTLDTFQKLFRQDMLIAALFRNFLLTERVMLENGCHVVSHPELPSVSSHPLWDYWDQTLDIVLANMHTLLAQKGGLLQLSRSDFFLPTSLKHNLLIELTPAQGANSLEHASHSAFFIEQLEAFECWLKFAVDKQAPPQQLPILLQVLLSQVHRVRAVELLARFVDLGSWAVVAALSVGIFPYVLKLIQSCNTKELRPSLAFIWAKILSVDPACQVELVKENEFHYFLQILNDHEVEACGKIVPAYVMATLIYNNFRPAQEKLVDSDFLTLCFELLSHEEVMRCRLLCLWLLIGLGRLWSDHDRARWWAVRNVAYEAVEGFLQDDIPEVRAAAVYALGCFVHNRTETEHATVVEHAVCDTLCERCTYDSSVLVRFELIAAIQWFLLDFEESFSDMCIDLDAKHFGGHPATRENEREGELTINTISPPRRSGSSLSNVSGRSHKSSSTVNGAIHGTLRRRLRPSDNTPPMLENVPYISEFKSRVLVQMRALESKNFNDPLERIWLSLLRMCLDPHDGVAKSAIKLVTHIFDLAAAVRLSRLNLANHLHHQYQLSPSARQSGSSQQQQRSSANQSTESSPNPVKFMIGSPAMEPASFSASQQQQLPPQLSLPPPPRISRLSSAEEAANFVSGSSPTPALQTCTSISDLLTRGAIETSMTGFTPKRHIWGNAVYANRRHSTGHSHAASMGLVYTEFVEWSSRVFTTPIYHTIHGFSEAETSSRNCLVDSATPFTMASPTDWALHTHEGVRQRGQKESELLKSGAVKCETQYACIRCERTVTSCVWSFLRPYIYLTDGEKIMLHHTSAGGEKKWEFEAIGENGLLNGDAISDIMVANELTHELLLTGTRNGILKVWDPMFHEHSHEVTSPKPKLITAAHLLNDLPRIERSGMRGKESIYCWDQSAGRLACTGNVKVCRVWDAWAEKTAVELAMPGGRNIMPTSLACDLANDIVSCGFTDGSFTTYDVRLPASECEILRVREFTSPVVGVYLCGSGPSTIVASSAEADITVWDPRICTKPLASLNVNSLLSNQQHQQNGGLGISLGTPVLPQPTLHYMDVQKSSQLVACAMSDSSIYMFDVLGKSGCLTKIKHSSLAGSESTTLSTLGAITKGGNYFSSLRRSSSSQNHPQLLEHNAQNAGANSGGQHLSRPSAMRFHMNRVALGVATKSNYFIAYGLPPNT